MPAHLCRFPERFGSLHRLEAFLGSVNSAVSLRIAAELPITARFRECGFACTPCLATLGWPYHLTTQLILLRHPFTPTSEGRNVNRLPIGYGFRLSLRVPPNPGRTSLPQVPLGLRGEGFSPSSRYSCLHPHLDFVQQPSRVCLLPTVQRSPTNTRVFRSFGEWL